LPSDVVNEEGIIVRKKMIVGLVAAALTLVPTGVALANTQYPVEGGKWEYDNGFTSAWSYYTVDRCHGSSITRNGTVVSRSVDTIAGQKSDAYTNHAPWTSGYHFYYRVC
jgi:hypothetical protein